MYSPFLFQQQPDSGLLQKVGVLIAVCQKVGVLIALIALFLYSSGKYGFLIPSLKSLRIELLSWFPPVIPAKSDKQILSVAL